MYEDRGRKRKLRLDMLLVKKNLAESREKAKLLIMLGYVKVNGQTVRKPSKSFCEDVSISIIKPFEYVSRGALKLKRALEDFGIREEKMKGKVACDMGASTGGFTQILLEFGVEKVYAIDVGYGVIHWKLRKDPRVVVMERTNARYLNENTLGEKVDIVTCDLSFISVCKVAEAIRSILKDGGNAFILIKPQFEANKKDVKKGVVKDRKVHIHVIEKVVECMEKVGLQTVNLTFSKLRGPKGNIEFFIHIEKREPNKGISKDLIERIVNDAYSFFEVKDGDESK